MRRDVTARSRAPQRWRCAAALAVLIAGRASAQSTPIAHYDFEEPSWSGAANEVRDQSGNALHGTAAGGATTANATPAIAGGVGTCRYASFDGGDDYVRIPDAAQLDLTGGVSMAAWIRHRSSSYRAWEAILTKGDSSYRLHLNGGCSIPAVNAGNPAAGITFGLNGGCAGADLNSLQVPQADTWYHVGATWRSGEMRVYVNGSLRNQAAYNATVAVNAFDLFIGENSQQRGRYWNGDIDEVTLWSGAVTPAEIQAHMATTHACPDAAVHFVVAHDNYGIHCSAEPVRVEVRDGANNPFTGYSQQVTLDTQSGKGDWSLVSGGGTFSNGPANDGVATYRWVAGETQATFSLSYGEGSAALDIDVSQSDDATIRDDDTEGAIAFAASGFTVTSSGLANPPGAIAAFPSPQVAGADVALHLAAFGQTPGDPQCGVIESYTGAKALRFWYERVNPATGTRQVSIDGLPAAASEALAVPQSVLFSNGQAVVTAKYKDVGLMRIGTRDDAPGHPDLSSGIRGSTGNVVFRPATFTLSGVLRADNGAANPAASSAAGPVFLAAGMPFATSVTAHDAEGSATPNYGHESPPESVRLQSNLLAPAGGVNPPVSAVAGFGAFSAGVASGNDFHWPEVGIISLTPHVADASYLGAGDVAGSASEPVGRFVPNDFAVANNVPVFQTGCPAGSFTYVGQPFSYAVAPIATLTARAVGGATTRNYTGQFWKLTNTSLSARQYTASAIALDISGLPPANVDPVISDSGSGSGTLTFASGSGLSLLRSTPIAPVTPHIVLSIVIRDEDAVAAATNPHTFGQPGGIAFSASAEQRYGRLAFRNAAAPELFALPLPLRAEYYLDDTMGFAANGSDVCTSGIDLQWVSYAGDLDSGETCVIDSGAPGASGAGCPVAGPAAQRFRQPPSAGSFNLHLAPSGPGNSGSVTLRASAPPWLEFDWDATAAGLEDPVGTATFGVYEGNTKRIHQRERY